MKKGKNAKKNRRLFCGQAAVSSFGNNITGPFIPYYLTRLGASVEAMGNFQALQNLLPNILQLQWGYLSDKIRKRIPFIVIGTLVASLLLVSITFVSNVTLIIVLLSISAVVASMGTPTWSALMGDKIKHKHRGRNFSEIANYALAAGLLGSLTVLFIFYTRPATDIAPYRWLFVAGAIIGIVSLAFVFPLKDNSKGDHALKMLTPKELDKDFRYFLFAQSTYNFFMAIGWPLFYITQAKILGATNTELAIVTIVSLGATIAFQPLVGKLIDKTGSAWLITVSRFISVTVPFAYAFATSMYQLYIFNIAIGFVSAIGNVAFSTYILDVSPPEAKAEYFAYYNITTGITGFFGSLLAGILATFLMGMWSLTTALIAVYIICGAGRLAASFLFLKVKDPKPYPSTPWQFAAAYRERIRWLWRRP